MQETPAPGGPIDGTGSSRRETLTSGGSTKDTGSLTQGLSVQPDDKRGYSSVTIKEIARRTGQSRGLVLPMLHVSARTSSAFARARSKFIYPGLAPNGWPESETVLSCGGSSRARGAPIVWILTARATPSAGIEGRRRRPGPCALGQYQCTAPDLGSRQSPPVRDLCGCGDREQRALAGRGAGSHRCLPGHQNAQALCRTTVNRGFATASIKCCI
jgi:hypothetical protein